MPLYEDQNTTREDLFELRKRNRCKQCGGMLNVFLDRETGLAFLACNDWPRTHHQGIAREAEPPFEPNIATRREIMVEEIGEAKATALEKYQGVVSLTREQAIYVLQTMWPEAPEVEVIKAAMVCAQYGLNPLWRHIFLIPFKKRNKKGEVIGVEWRIIRGIGADRLMAQRRHHFSYLDLSPRRMTEDEQTKIRGEVDNSKIWAITKLKDMDTGAEAMGIGSWPVGEEPHGVEKGNTKLNMACIHSERQALDRQYPGEMPQGVEVMDEKYIEGDYTLLAQSGEKIGAKVEERGGGRKPAATSLSPQKGEKPGGAPPTAEHAKEKIEGEGFYIDLPWLGESLNVLKWTNETAKTFLVSKYKVSPQGTLEDVIKRLTREQAEDFVNEIQSKTQKQLELL